jgi:hypothetical protein
LASLPEFYRQVGVVVERHEPSLSHTGICWQQLNLFRPARKTIALFVKLCLTNTLFIKRSIGRTPRAVFYFGT